MPRAMLRTGAGDLASESFVLGRGATQRAFLAHVKHDPCSYCGTPGAVLDHIDPRFKATAPSWVKTRRRPPKRIGSDQWGNLTASCVRCNGLKSRRSLLGFLGWRRSGSSERLAIAQAEQAAWFGVGS